MKVNAPKINSPQKIESMYALSGDLVYSTVPEFVKSEQALFSLLVNDVVVDCSALKRVDSAGLSLLLEWKRECQKQQKQCSFESLPSQAVSLIETFKLKALL